MAIAPRVSSDQRFPDETTAALAQLLEPTVTAHGLYLEELVLKPSGPDTVLRVTVDYESGTEQVDLDKVAALAEALGTVLDAAESRSKDENPLVDVVSYDLEVSTPGATRPLTEPRHFRRNTGRLLELDRQGEPAITARLIEVDDDGIIVTEITPAPKKGMPAKTGPQTHVRFDDISRARVQVEFS
ncbi:ribosome maturation factor RimP [Nesterenkonia flava]|uniref:Ribosome maturation factor RimP n=1 Tax=Nesterenkonia flava TaxID=469799 RepID=A0ABU1FR49_9MICC|nr:ribosome maturation factor RimP [Nesterenkonia flava]MDR5711125.1 ribosome maturation factor RimP [Nesterenkonia flava]